MVSKLLLSNDTGPRSHSLAISHNDILKQGCEWISIGFPGKQNYFRRDFGQFL